MDSQTAIEVGRNIGLVLGGAWVAFQAVSARTTVKTQESRLAMGVDSFREIKAQLADHEARLTQLEKRRGP